MLINQHLKSVNRNAELSAFLEILAVPVKDKEDMVRYAMTENKSRKPFDSGRRRFWRTRTACIWIASGCQTEIRTCHRLRDWGDGVAIRVAGIFSYGSID